MNRDFTEQDLQENKAMAALGYLVFFLPLILRRDSKLCRYCANQGLILLVVTVLINLLLTILQVIPLIGGLFLLLRRLITFALVLVELLCFIQLMTNDRVIELPYIGHIRLLP